MKICIVVTSSNQALIYQKMVNNPDIFFLPIFGPFTGRKFDLIISPESAYDPKLHNKNLKWIEEVLKKKLTVDGKIIFV